MDWKKSKLTRWTAGTFTITEEINGARPFRLDGPDDSPQHFETLTEAKAHASTLNELEVYKAEVRRLRAELDTKAKSRCGSTATPRRWLALAPSISRSATCFTTYTPLSKGVRP